MPTLDDLFQEAPTEEYVQSPSTATLDDLFNIPEPPREQRDAAYFLGRLEHYRQTGSGREEDEISDFLPFTGQANSFVRARHFNNAVEAIDAGRGTPQHFEDVASTIAAQERQKNEGFWRGVGEGIIRMPAFIGEVLATGGAAGAARTGVMAGGARALGTAAAESLAGRIALQGAGAAAYVGTQAALNPQHTAATAARLARPDIGVNQQGELAVERYGSTAGNLPLAFADTMVTFGSEKAGELIGIGWQALGKTSVGPIIRTAADRWASSAVGRVLSLGEGATANSIRNFSREAGYHGLIGEMFEERVDEVLKGAIGTQPNYGATGDVLTGRWAEASRQLAQEFMTFAAIPVAQGVANRALRGSGVSEEAATRQLADVVNALDFVRKDEGTRETALATLNRLVPEDSRSRPDQAVRGFGLSVIEAMFPESKETQQTQPAITQITTEEAPEAETPTIAPEERASTSEQIPTTEAPEAQAGQNQGGSEQEEAPRPIPMPSAADKGPRTAPKVNEPVTGNAQELLERYILGEPIPTAQIAKEAKMTEKQATVFFARLAMHEDKMPSLQQVGESLGISPKAAREAARQLEAKAMKRLKIKGSLEEVRKKYKEMQAERGKISEQSPNASALPGTSGRATSAKAREAETKAALADVGKATGEQTLEIPTLDSVGKAWEEALKSGNAESIAAAEKAFVDFAKAETAKGSGGSYYGKRQTPVGQTPTTGKGPVIGPFEWIATLLNRFNATRVIGKVRGNREAQHLDHVRLLEIESMHAGSTSHAAHEVGHDIMERHGFETNPVILARDAGQDVVDGFREFDYDPNRPLGPQAIREGFAVWFEARLHGQIAKDYSNIASPNMVAAAKYAEEWMAGHGYTEKMDQMAELWIAYHSADPVEKAKRQFSPRGGQATAAGLTTTEAAASRAKDILFRLRELHDDNLAVLANMMKEINKRRAASGMTALPSWLDLRTIYAQTHQLMGGMGDRWVVNGPSRFNFDQNGMITETTIGPALRSITDPFDPKDLSGEGTGVWANLKRAFGMPASMKGSRLDVWIGGGYAIDSVNRGMDMQLKGKLFERYSEWLNNSLQPGFAAPNAQQLTQKIVQEWEAHTGQPFIQYPPGTIMPPGGQRLTNKQVKQLANLLQTEGEKLQEEAKPLINIVGPTQLEAFKKAMDHERQTDPAWVVKAEKAAKEFAAWTDLLLETKLSVGWYNQQQVDNLRKKYPGFIHMFRIVEGQDFKPNAELMRHGTGRLIESPFEALKGEIDATAYIVTKQLNAKMMMLAAKQPVGPAGVGNYFVEADPDQTIERTTNLQEKLDALKIPRHLQGQLIAIMGPDIVQVLSPSKWSETGKNTYTFREDGKPVTLNITSRPLYELLTNTQVENSSLATAASKIIAIPYLGKFLTGTTRFVRWNATTFNAVFPVRNIPKDIPHYMQNVDGGPLEKISGLILGHIAAHKGAAQSLFGKDLDPQYRVYKELSPEQLREYGGYAHGGEAAKAWRAIRGDGKFVENIVWTWETTEGLFELMNAGEQGPRFAEGSKYLNKAGYTNAQIKAALQANPLESPIPLQILWGMRQAMANATVDFTRKGIAIAEWTKISPFLSAHMAGMSQEIRNWNKALEEMKEGKIGPKSKAMVGTLAVLLGLEVAQWFAMKDEDWYKNLPAHLRYNWWILGQTSDGGTWGVPKPQGIMRMILAYWQELLRSGSGSSPNFGMATSANVDQAIPNGPIVATQAVQVFRNRDWRGLPIVPRRDEYQMEAFEKFRVHQLPYLLEQLSGGLRTDGRLRTPLEAFKSSRAEPNQPVHDYYEELNRLRGARARTMFNRQQFPDENRYDQLHSIEQRMSALGREARGERMVNGRVVAGEKPSADRLRQIRLEQVQLARRVLQK